MEVREEAPLEVKAVRRDRVLGTVLSPASERRNADIGGID
jgi:hypothetical protein